MAYLLAWLVFNHETLFEMNKNGGVHHSRCELRLRLEEIPSLDKDNADNHSLTSNDIYANSVRY